jgi:flagellar hook-associated protein 1 FlgK
MSTIFGSFEIGRKALRVQHKGMEVSGQNVANANTPGYSRQRAEMAAVVPPIVPGPSLAPGRGVVITDIARVRSEFYHAQMVKTGSHKAFWEMKKETFQGIEAVFMEPDDYGINKYLGDFFDNWQELSSSPEDISVRNALRENAISLTRSFEDVYLRLEDLRIDLSGELYMRVDEVNRIADSIAELNEKLRFIDALQQKSNELLDQLDLAVEELSKLVDIRVHHKANGTVEIFAGGRLLVQEDQAFHLAVEGDGNSGYQLVSHRGLPLKMESGRVLALIDAVNADIPAMQEELNLIAATIIEEVNNLHFSGFGLQQGDGVNFFNPIGNPDLPASLQFKVSDLIMEDSSYIAASSQFGEPGNGEMSLEIARLRDFRAEDRLNGSSLAEYYRGIVTSMGVQAQESERMVEAFGKTEAELIELHRSIAGVNMDEEMLNMVQYQHAWNAAARYLSYVDEMLTILFTELGR